MGFGGIKSEPEVTKVKAWGHKVKKWFFPIFPDSCSYLVLESQKWTWGHQGQNLRSQGQKMTFSQFWLMLLFLSSKWFCLLWKLYLVTLLPMISLNDWYLDAPISYLHAFFYCPTRPELCDSRSLLFVYCSFCLLFNPSRRTMRSLIALVPGAPGLDLAAHMACFQVSLSLVSFGSIPSCLISAWTVSRLVFLGLPLYDVIPYELSLWMNSNVLLFSTILCHTNAYTMGNKW